MLNIQKSINLNGYSIAGGRNVIYMTATISTDSSGMTQPSINQTVIDTPTYIANKEECRKDLSEFTQMVYNIQDETLIEASKVAEKQEEGGQINESK